MDFQKFREKHRHMILSSKLLFFISVTVQRIEYMTFIYLLELLFVSSYLKDNIERGKKDYI
jgi:hypothetical protein